MNRNGAIKMAQKMLNNKSTMSKSDVLYLISRITADSTYEQKEEGARLLIDNVKAFDSLEFNSVVKEYKERTGFEPRN